MPTIEELQARVAALVTKVALQSNALHAADRFVRFDDNANRSGLRAKIRAALNASESECAELLKLAREAVRARQPQRIGINSGSGGNGGAGGGGAGFALAEIMGEDADWAKRVGDADAALVCDACAVRSVQTPIAGLVERMNDLRDDHVEMTDEERAG